MADHRSAIRQSTRNAFLLLAAALLVTGCGELLPFPNKSDTPAPPPSAATAAKPIDQKGDVSRETRTVTVKRDYYQVNIRPTPGMENAPLGKVRGGSRLSTLMEQGNWLEVAFTDASGHQAVGWIYKYLIEGFEKPSRPPSTAPEPAATTPEPEDGSLQETATPQAPGQPVTVDETAPVDEPSIESESDSAPEPAADPAPPAKPISIL